MILTVNVTLVSECRRPKLVMLFWQNGHGSRLGKSEPTVHRGDGSTVILVGAQVHIKDPTDQLLMPFYASAEQRQFPVWRAPVACPYR